MNHQENKEDYKNIYNSDFGSFNDIEKNKNLINGPSFNQFPSFLSQISLNTIFFQNDEITEDKQTRLNNAVNAFKEDVTQSVRSLAKKHNLPQSQLNKFLLKKEIKFSESKEIIEEKETRLLNAIEDYSINPKQTFISLAKKYKINKTTLINNLKKNNLKNREKTNLETKNKGSIDISNVHSFSNYKEESGESFEKKSKSPEPLEDRKTRLKNAIEDFKNNDNQSLNFLAKKHEIRRETLRTHLEKRNLRVPESIKDKKIKLENAVKDFRENPNQSLHSLAEKYGISESMLYRNFIELKLKIPEDKTEKKMNLALAIEDFKTNPDQSILSLAEKYEIEWSTLNYHLIDEKLRIPENKKDKKRNVELAVEDYRKDPTQSVYCLAEKYEINPVTLYENLEKNQLKIPDDKTDKKRNLELAIQDFQNHSNKSILSVAKKYGVNHSTLSRHLKDSMINEDEEEYNPFEEDR